LVVCLGLEEDEDVLFLNDWLAAFLALALPERKVVQGPPVLDMQAEP